MTNYFRGHSILLIPHTMVFNTCNVNQLNRPGKPSCVNLITVITPRKDNKLNRLAYLLNLYCFRLILFFEPQTEGSRDQEL